LHFIGFYNYTVILTYLSLICGMLGMGCAYVGNLDAAILCLLLSGVCDLFDGPVARTKQNRTEQEKSFGIQLDSLCDLVCFGVFPAVFFYLCGIRTRTGIVLLLFYVLCALIRLAFFNVLEIERQRTEGGCAKSYHGLPVTSIAITLPLYYLVARLWLSAHAALLGYHILAFTTAILFISNFRVPKLDISRALSRLRRKKERSEEQ